VNDKLFIPQTVLYRWVDTGKVTFDNQILTLLAEKKAYTVTPAVRFVKLIAGDDAAGLLTKVRTLSKLRELGAEHLSDSVILGDNAYEVQEGFIGVVLADAEVATKTETVAAPAPPPVVAPTPVAATPVAAAPPVVTSLAAAGGKTSESSDADLLTKFLLNNLNF
jgi:hypothetical protein